MSLAEITTEDLMRLENLRIERLLSFFASTLPRCLIYIDLSNTLAIHCAEPRIVDDLIHDLEDLSNYAWLILGVTEIALYFSQEEIFRTYTYGVPNINYPMVQ